MGIAFIGVPAAFTSSTPPVMRPWPSAVKLPVRARGVALKLPVKNSPLVTKAYWPFKSALLKLPTGGGGVTKLLVPPQAALQRAAAAVRPSKRRFIAHLAGLPFDLATRGKRESAGSLWCCGRRRPERPFARCERQRWCRRQEPSPPQ